MAGFDHGSTKHDEPECATTAARNSKLGLQLFACYLAVYGSFVLLNAFAPGVMEQTVGGVNLAIVSGFALIVGALALALVYGWACRAPVGDANEPGESA